MRFEKECPRRRPLCFFKAAYNEIENAAPNNELIGLDLMFERVMKFIDGR